jgi:hypothetical protein
MGTTAPGASRAGLADAGTTTTAPGAGCAGWADDGWGWGQWRPAVRGSGLTGAEDRPVRVAALGAEAAAAVQDEKMKLSREVNCVVHREREVARCYENFKNASYQGNVPLCIFVG